MNKGSFGQMSGVGPAVRRFREEREWTNAQLAVYAGLAPSAVSEIENGKRNASAATLVKLAEAFQVEVSDLFPKAQAPLPLPPEKRRAVEEREGLVTAHKAATQIGQTIV